MPLRHIIGLDHVVVVVRDLDQAAQTWRNLGFTVSPRGTHSAHMGSGNYTIMLDPDYIELLGVLTPTAHNAPTRDYLATNGEGIERAAFTTDDAAAGVEEIRARGFAGNGPIDFGRPVSLPGGGTTEARFRVFQWPLTETPAGMRIFACQHLTREAVWIPELMRHANTARRIKRVEMLAADPAAAAAHLGRLIDRAPEQQPDGWRVPSGSGRADFVFADAGALRARHAGLAGEPRRQGAAVLVLEAADLDVAARALGPVARRHDGGLLVAPEAAHGVALRFEAAA